MFGKSYRFTQNNRVHVLVTEDGKYYAYDADERWNGEYYKGWESDEWGEALDFDSEKECVVHISNEAHIYPVYENNGDEIILIGYEIKPQ